MPRPRRPAVPVAVRSRVSASWQPDDLGEAADPVGRLGAHALSSGDVTVRIGGVRDAAHLDALIGAMRGIRGIGGVRLRATEPIHSPVVVLNATRPIALASELRSELGRQVTSCVFVDGEIELELDGTAPDPAPRRPRRTDRRGALADDGPPLRPRPRPSRHRPPDGLGVRPGTGGATPGPADDDVLRRAVDEVDSLAVLAFDADLRFVRAAGALHERHDRGTSELLGRRPDELVDAASWQVLRPGYEGALAGQVTTLDTPSLDGRRLYRATFRPTRAGDRVVGGSVTLLDVTDVRREERRLEELRDVLASCFEGTPTGQAIISPEIRFMRVNPALERLLRLDATALVDRPVPDVVLPRERERVEGLLRALAAGERVDLRVDVPVVLGDGEVLDAHVGVTAIRTREGALRGFFAHLAPVVDWTTSAS